MVTHAVELVASQRDLLALLLVWGIGKPWHIALADVDRCIDGVRWYLEQIPRQLTVGTAEERTPLSGPVSNIASWNYPMSVQLHSELVQILAGNGVIADTNRRHILEQEGLNAWGIGNSSQWDMLTIHLRKGFEYAKQRCTAYPCYVIQRRLLPRFLDDYLPMVRDLTFGHPLAVEHDDDELPVLDFGPVIHSTKAASLARQVDEALDKVAAPLYHGLRENGRFLDGQDVSAYIAPAAVLTPSSSCSLHHAEPFGPLDSIVLVDTEAELLAAMNVSDGNLVASIATDDPGFATRVADELRSFKVGVNCP